MKIAYISRFESIDIKNWSGSEYYIAQAIGEKAGNQIDCIAGLQEELDLWTRIKYQLNIKSGKKYQLNRAPYVVKQYAKQVEQQLLNLNSDIVFSPGTMPIAHLHCKQPKVFYTDATFAGMINYYDWYQNLSNITIKEGLELDRIALETSALAIFASDWAAKSAIDNYGVNPDKIRVVPFGANIDKELSFDEIKLSVSNRSKDICKIVFIGVDWIRKGGDIVFETVRHLNNSGLKTELHIVGLNNIPTVVADQPFVFNHGFISKATSEGLNQIEKIISDCHFLFVPSKAEAYGLVFCEASAYGLPSISNRTGGITTIIIDGINGMTFDIEAKPEEYANYIQDTFADRKKYEDLALSSYNEYKSRLNWDVAGKTISNYMKELLQ